MRLIDFEKRTILLIWERPSGAETSGLLKALWGEIQSELEFSTRLGSGSSWGALPGGSKVSGKAILQENGEIEISLLTIYFQEEMPPQVFLRLRTTIKSHPAH